MKTPKIFADDLARLRAGSLDFDRFARIHMSRLRRWAGYFFDRWPQSALDLDDLTQEALLEAWRSVDLWDPTRGVALERFVEYRVGSRLRTELQRVLGWPKKSRGTKAVRPISLDHHEAVKRWVESRASESLTPVDLELLRETIEEFTDPLTRDVVAGIGMGLSRSATAARIYADPDRRLRYRLDSPDHATRRVSRALDGALSALGSEEEGAEVSIFETY